MKYYIFSEYSDKAGTGHDEIFKSEAEALEAADRWDYLTKSDKAFYHGAAWYEVFEVELSDEEYAFLTDKESEGLSRPIQEYATRYIKDYLEAEDGKNKL